MSAIPFTPEQVRAIEHRSGPLLLVANAGSGKTSVMVERFVRTVVDDGVPLRSVLAITFTEKAAAQLEERVRARFAALGRDDLARAAEEAPISTIHALCAQILRAGALPAGLDPRFAVADPDEADGLARAAFDDALAEILERRGAPALDLLATYRLDDLRVLVTDVHGRLRSRGLADPELPPAAPADPAPARTALAAAAGALVAELAGRPEPSNGAAKALDAAQRAVELTAGTGALPGHEALAAARLANGAVKAAPEAGEAYLEALRAAEQAAWDAACGGPYEELRALLRSFARHYAAAKRARSLLDFEDLELHTERLLSGDPVAAARWSRRFARVMVDEFQDTNPLQLRIAERLAAPAPGAAGDGALFAVGDEFQSIYRFRHADVDGFRARRRALAERGLAWPLRTNFRSGAELIAALNLTWAGGPGAGEGDGEAGDGLLGPGFQPLEPSPAALAAAPSPEPPVEVLVTDKEGWRDVDLGAADPTGIAWRVAESRLLAQRLGELVDAGRSPAEIVVLLRASTDMALFERALQDAGLPTYVVGGRGYWSHRQVQDVVAWLSVLANPRDELRLFEVLASPLVGVSSDALFLLADAGRALGGGPWVAIQALESGAAIGALARPDATGRGAPQDPAALLDAVPGRDRACLGRFAARLRAQRERVARRSLDALIDEVVRETGYDLAVLAMRGGERRLANVRKLQRLARAFEADRGADLRGFLDRVAAAADEDAPDREAEAAVEGEGLRAIRLMTIHRAKGLEFPVVCVADLGRLPVSAARDTLRFDDEGRVGLKLTTAEGERLKAFAYEAIGDVEARAAEEEERRLFYVATTRAEEHLILSGGLPLQRLAEGKAAREPLAWLGTALMPDLLERLDAEAPDAEVVRDAGRWRARVRVALNAPATLGRVLREPAPLVEEAPDEAPGGRPVDDLLPGESPGALPLAGAVADVPGEVSYTALEAYRRCPYRFFLQRIIGLGDLDPPRAGGAAGPAGLPGTVRGTLAHELLEVLDLRAPDAPGAEAALAAAARHGARASREEAEEVAAMVAAFAGSPLRARLAAAADVRREEPFAFLLRGAAAAPLVGGVFDVLAREGERALVVDYKSDRLHPGADLERVTDDEYATQRLVYALAALEAGHPAVEVVHVYLERPDDPVSVAYAAADAPELQERLGALAAGLVAGVHAPTPVPHRELCATCPGRPSLCSHPEELTLRDRPAPAGASPQGSLF